MSKSRIDSGYEVIETALRNAALSAELLVKADNLPREEVEAYIEDKWKHYVNRYREMDSGKLLAV